jgi:hypothetical protein
MAAVVELLGREPMTLESAQKTDDNIIIRSSQFFATKGFYLALWDSKSSIQDAVVHQLGLDLRQDSCIVCDTREWMPGKFNVCVPVVVNSKDSAAR